jgi:cold shock CspA family protein
VERGKIKRVIVDRGFCFVEPEDGGRDRFLHVGALPKGTTFSDALVGRTVEYETEQADKGPKAVRARIVEGSN